MCAIKAIALDVDGSPEVWVGDGVWNPTLLVCRHMGVSLARKAGLAVTLISGNDSPLVDPFAAKFQLAEVPRAARTKPPRSATSRCARVWSFPKSASWATT